MSKCQKCDVELDDFDLEANTAAHDNSMVEVYFNCPECEAYHYAFIPLAEFTVSE